MGSNRVSSITECEPADAVQRGNWTFSGSITTVSSTVDVNVTNFSSTGAVNTNAYQAGTWSITANASSVSQINANQSGTWTVGLSSTAVTANQGGSWTLSSISSTIDVSIKDFSNNFSQSSTDVTNAAGIILAANTSRKSWMITNNSDSTTLYVGNNTLTTSNGHPLSYGQSIFESMPYVYQGEIYGITSSGTINARCIEES